MSERQKLSHYRPGGDGWEDIELISKNGMDRERRIHATKGGRGRGKNVKHGGRGFRGPHHGGRGQNRNGRHGRDGSQHHGGIDMHRKKGTNGERKVEGNHNHRKQHKGLYHGHTKHQHHRQNHRPKNEGNYDRHKMASHRRKTRECIDDDDRDSPYSPRRSCLPESAPSDPIPALKETKPPCCLSSVCQTKNSTSFPALHGLDNKTHDSDNEEEEGIEVTERYGAGKSGSDDESNQRGKNRQHRVPLSIPKNHEIEKVVVLDDNYNSMDDLISVLESHPPLDEYNAVQSELRKCNEEIMAIENDRMTLETMLKEAVESDGVHTNGMHAMTNFQVSRQLRSWDIDWLLENSSANQAGKSLFSPSVRITHGQKRYLRRRRGRNFLIKMFDEHGKKAFWDSCAGTASSGRNSCGSACSGSGNNPEMGVLFEESVASAANTGNQVRCISLLGGTGDATLTSGSYFISFDDGTSYIRGALPPRLSDRMERECQRTGSSEDISLRYLATGPGGSYYTELTTGECWWGTCYNDKEFHDAVSEIDVHRVAFGPCFPEGEDEEDNRYVEKQTEEEGEEAYFTMKTTSVKKMMSSWIILGRDGKSVWRNIPARLHHQLTDRGPDMAAPCEVSLGRGGSYFVKFMDGTIDYCLPAMEADICNFLENGGMADNAGGRKVKRRASSASAITSIVMHVESCDYIFRHSGPDD